MENIQLITELYSYLKEHFDFSNNKEYYVVLCWALGTWVNNIFNAYPRLLFYGPKQSGKSKILHFLSKICYNAEYTIIPSTAAMFRIIQKWRPTLLLDEFNLYSANENKEVLAILRQGYKKGGKVPRCERMRIKTEDGSRELQEVIFYEVYCPIALAGLTINDDQLLDRCIAINLVRSNNLNIINTSIDDTYFKEDMTWDNLKEFIDNIINAEELIKIYDEVSNSYIPISGRDKEIWIPLLTVAHYFKTEKNKEVWDAVIFYMQDYVKRKQEEDLSSFDLRVLAEIGRLDDLEMFQAKEVADLLNEGATNVKEQVTSHSVGHALKRLGIPFKIRTGKKYYTLNEEQYLLLKQRFGLQDNG